MKTYKIRSNKTSLLGQHKAKTPNIPTLLGQHIQNPNFTNLSKYFDKDASSLLNKSKNPKKGYWDIMATPRTLPQSKENQRKKPKRKICISSKFCPPRIDVLSLPRVSHLEGLLSSHPNILEPETVCRVVKLIHNGLEARSFVAESLVTNKTKNKKKVTPSKCSKKLAQQEWLANQIDTTTRLLLNAWFLRANVAPNYLQLILASQLMSVLNPKRKNTLIMGNIRNFCEQMAIVADRNWELRGNMEHDTSSIADSSIIADEEGEYSGRRISYVASQEGLTELDTISEYSGFDGDDLDDFAYPTESNLLTNRRLSSI